MFIQSGGCKGYCDELKAPRFRVLSFHGLQALPVIGCLASRLNASSAVAKRVHVGGIAWLASLLFSCVQTALANQCWNFRYSRPCWNFISQLMSGFIILENGQRAEEWRSSPFKFGKPAIYMFSGLSGLSRDRVHFDGKALAACVRWIGDVQIPALLNLCG